MAEEHFARVNNDFNCMDYTQTRIDDAAARNFALREWVNSFSYSVAQYRP